MVRISWRGKGYLSFIILLVTGLFGVVFSKHFAISYNIASSSMFTACAVINWIVGMKLNAGLPSNKRHLFCGFQMQNFSFVLAPMAALMFFANK
jgi:hypothetical protein